MNAATLERMSVDRKTKSRMNTTTGISFKTIYTAGSPLIYLSWKKNSKIQRIYKIPENYPLIFLGVHNFCTSYL